MVHAYANSRQHSPASLAAAIALSGTIIVGIVLSGPVVQMIQGDSPIETYWVTPDAPPPEPLPAPPARPEVATRDIFVPDVIVPVPRPLPAPPIDTTRDPAPPPLPPLPGGTGSANGTIPRADPAPAEPVLTRAEIDPRYARDFQPEYPSAMLRRDAEARLVVRVLVGTDGRVKAVEQVGRSEPVFFDATRRHALARWRFRPATRDGVAVEQWREMGVRFQLVR